MHISLINLPRYEIHRPPLGLAILSAICVEEQVKFDCYDFSLEIYQQLQSDFFDIDNFCITNIINPSCQQRLEKLIDCRVKTILDQHPETIFAMSLLSTWSQPVCKLFCKSIRRQSQCKIMLGGQGLNDKNWTDGMIENELIDHYIIGEGEIPFRKFLQGETNIPGLDNYNFQQINDLDSYCVIPNYQKLPLLQYPYLGNNPDFFITASRGCVRRCGYCDVGHLWKKYRYRSANHVAKEMITQYERHGIHNFFFTDSLINGSMKMLNELCDRLIEYKKTNPDAKFEWKGQYIFRPKELVKERHIQRMAEAGVSYLIIGLETGSDKVRYDMDKKHTTADAEWFLEMFKKYGINCHLLMLTGWVTETLEDHGQTMALFPQWQKYVASGTISGIELGSTLAIIEHSPVGKDIDKYEISMINNKPYLWVSNKNPGLTIGERYRRRAELHREAIKYHWPITRGLYRLNTIKHHIQEAVEHLSHNPRLKIQRTWKLLST